MTTPAAPLPRRRFIGRALAALAGGAWFGRTVQVGDAEAAPQGGDQPYISEIRMFAGDFAPLGWAFCEGQFLSISQYEALFQLIGTTYGGDGQVTFALPDLRGRAPVHMGQGPGLSPYSLGQVGGVEQLTLTVPELPAHSHAAGASNANGTSDDPTGRVPARNAAGVPQYGTTVDANLAPGAMLPTGGSSPHGNMQPYLCIHYIICLEGIFPTP
jgi:microcystin-dependent protein